MELLLLIANDLQSLLHDQVLAFVFWAFSAFAFLGILALRLPHDLVEEPAAILTYVFATSSLGYILVCMSVFFTQAFVIEFSNYISLFMVLAFVALLRVFISARLVLKKGKKAYG